MIALPAAEAASTPINVNSATAVVLTGSGQGFSLNDAQAIAAYRQAQGGFRSLNNFLTLPILKNRTISTQNFSIDSNFFLLKTLVSLNNQQLTVYTLFERTKNYGLKTNDIKLLWQLRGTL
jgi:type II secretory pathway component PulK